MTTLLSILSLVCIASYTAAVCIKQKGIPASISATFYKLEHKYWFGFTMFATPMLFMPAILEVLPEEYQFLGFLICVGMMAVGAAPNFKEGIEQYIHVVGCCISLIIAQILVGICNPSLFILWALFLVYMSVRIKNYLYIDSIITILSKAKTMFFVEIVVLIQTYLCYFLELCN